MEEVSREELPEIKLLNRPEHKAGCITTEGEDADMLFIS